MSSNAGTKVVDEKTLARVRSLIARGGHPSTPEEEARTCAIIAVRMIYAHGIPIGAVAAPGPSRPSPPPPRSRSYAVYKFITTKFEGWCKSCGRSFEAGETVAWVRGHGCTHEDCRSYWDERASEIGNVWDDD